jgi:hypothetical protein
LSMHPDDLELLAIGRPPELRSERLVRLSVKALASYLGGDRGTAMWESFMQPKPTLTPNVTEIMSRARAAERLAGGPDAAARMSCPPDAAEFVVEIDDVMPNWRPEVLASSGLWDRSGCSCAVRP